MSVPIKKTEAAWSLTISFRTSHSVISEIFYWLKQSQAHLDTRGMELRHRTQWGALNNSHILKLSQLDNYCYYLIECSVCARPCSRHFSYINLSNPSNTLWGWYYHDPQFAIWSLSDLSIIIAGEAAIAWPVAFLWACPISALGLANMKARFWAIVGPDSYSLLGENVLCSRHPVNFLVLLECHMSPGQSHQYICP